MPAVKEDQLNHVDGRLRAELTCQQSKQGQLNHEDGRLRAELTCQQSKLAFGSTFHWLSVPMYCKTLIIRKASSTTKIVDYAVLRTELTCQQSRKTSSTAKMVNYVLS